MKKNLLPLLVKCMVSIAAAAQPTGERVGQEFEQRPQGEQFGGQEWFGGRGQGGVHPRDGVRPQLLAPEQIAERRTDMMAAELGLTEKQHKQVYKLYLKQARKAQAARESSSAGGSPDFGAGGPGGGMRGGMNSPGGNFGGGMGGRRPESGQMGGGRPSGPPPGAMAGMPYEESEKDIAAREKKMGKILSPEQFAGWQRMDGEFHRDRFRRQFNRNVMPAER